MKNTETNKDFTNFDFKSVESAFGIPMRYANLELLKSTPN